MNIQTKLTWMNARSKDGVTAVMTACIHGHKYVVIFKIGKQVHCSPKNLPKSFILSYFIFEKLIKCAIIFGLDLGHIWNVIGARAPIAKNDQNDPQNKTGSLQLKLAHTNPNPLHDMDGLATWPKPQSGNFCCILYFMVEK